MYSLQTLRKLNAQRAAKPAREDETTRHCSHCVSLKTVRGREIRQVVLHSAKHRDTAYIEGAAATRFLAEIQATNSDVRRDAIVERWYNTAPTGKQSIAA